jgi:hypothetical protein
MGAETKVMVKVLRLTEDIIEVHAVCLADALTEAEKEPGVAKVLSAWYPNDECY